MLENYNECYHCGPVHPELCRLVPAFKQRGGSELDWERGIPHREGAWTFTTTGTTNRRIMLPRIPSGPLDPGRTRVVCTFLFHPGEIKQPEFKPADAVGFWDLVNCQDWAICEKVQRRMQSRVFQHGYYAPMERRAWISVGT